MSEVTVQGGQEVVGVGRIDGPIVVVEGGANVSYDEVVEIQDSRGQYRRGRVLERQVTELRTFQATLSRKQNVERLQRDRERSRHRRR